MFKYEITNIVSGQSLGVFVAASETEALEVMAREAGYRSFAQVEALFGSGEIVVSVVGSVVE